MEALAVIWSPVGVLSRVAEERRVLLGFGVVALYAALGLVGGVIGALFFSPQELAGAEELPPGFENLLPIIQVFSMIVAVVLPFVLWLLVAGLMHLVTRFFGGTGPFSGTLAIVGVAEMPFIILVIVGFLLSPIQLALLPDDPAAFGEPGAIGPATATIGLLSNLLTFAAYLWFAALVIIGGAFARRVGYGESAGSCAISCAGLLGLILLLVVAVVVLALVVFSAAGSGGQPT